MPDFDYLSAFVAEGAGSGGAEIGCGQGLKESEIRNGNAEIQQRVLRLTTPKLKDVWGPFRSG